MKDPEFRAEYEPQRPRMDLAMTLAEARRRAGLTQAQLAARMKTSQAAVARIESEHGAPNGRPSNVTPVRSARARWCACSKRRSDRRRVGRALHAAVRACYRVCGPFFVHEAWQVCVYMVNACGYRRISCGSLMLGAASSRKCRCEPRPSTAWCSTV